MVASVEARLLATRAGGGGGGTPFSLLNCCPPVAWAAHSLRAAGGGTCTETQPYVPPTRPHQPRTVWKRSPATSAGISLHCAFINPKQPYATSNGVGCRLPCICTRARGHNTFTMVWGSWMLRVRLPRVARWDTVSPMFRCGAGIPYPWKTGWSLALCGVKPLLMV